MMATDRTNGSTDREKPRFVRGFSMILVIGVLLVSCEAPRSDVVLLTGEAQGSTFTIKYRDPGQRDLVHEVDSILKGIDRSLSLWDSTSEVVRFNRAIDRFETGDVHFRTVLALAEAAYIGSYGTFDPTILPVVAAWGLGPRGKADMDTTAVAGMGYLVGLQRLSMDEIGGPGQGQVSSVVLYKPHPGVGLDPNGIAQGYTVDQLAVLLHTRGIANYMVEVGGEVRASGTNEQGRPWSIQIDRPEEGGDHQAHTVVPLQDRSLATSGNYRRFVELDGRRFGHTIDPRTGRPARNALLSASVMADNCAMADAYSTALMVMGPDVAKQWLERRPELDAYLIMDDGNGGYQIWHTPNWPGQ